MPNLLTEEEGENELNDFMMQEINYSNSYSYSLDSILKEFVLYLKHTFGETLQYVGTTTDPKTPSLRVLDIDLMLIFSQLNESHIIYVWEIINKLHSKYNIILDSRIYSTDEISSIPLVNRYLLSKYLHDLLGQNPFKDFEPSLDDLNRECLKRLQDQEQRIISIMPSIVGDSNQIKSIAQCVYDAIRAFLILDQNPIASKDAACSFILERFPKFSEAGKIYNSYLSPQSVINVEDFIIDSLALVKHLYYKAQGKEISNTVLLINAPSSIAPHPRNDYLRNDHNMPLGLVCVATYLEKYDHQVEILDSYAENMGVLSIIERIFDRASLPRIIGINTSSPNINVVHKIAGFIKRICQNVIIVAGGPHASIATEHTLSTGDIDYAVTGEGEIPFLKLVKFVFSEQIGEITNIPGIFSKVSGEITGKVNEELLDLALIPLPNFKILPLDRYFAVKKRIYLHTSRGCAFNCIYCSVPRCWGKKVQEIPSEVIISHVSELSEVLKPDELQIVDDNFSHHKGKLIKAFSEGLLAKDIRIKWKCQARADQLDREIVELMAKSGCFEVDIGIESGNEEIQKKIRKNLNLGKTLDIISIIHTHGIFVKAFFMLGFPDESYSQIADTINFAIKAKEQGLNDIAVFPVMPFPGTEIAETTGETVYQGATIDATDIFERSFSAQRMRKYTAKPEISLNRNFTPEKLRLLVKFAYQRFNFGILITNLEEEFSTYLLTEEDYIYGL